MQSFSFDELGDADLIVGARYCANEPASAINSEPLSPLMAVKNQGGIRFPKNRQYAVLYTTRDDPDWPDLIDHEFGVLTYFGDNKRPGRDLHAPTGNQLLRDVFTALLRREFHAIPPFFVFSRLEGRDVRFEGLAIPGSASLPVAEGLAAIWRTRGGQPFQNYRSTFTFLDEGRISRLWLRELRAGQAGQGPPTFEHFRRTGQYQTRLAPRTVSDFRTKSEQLPCGEDLRMIELVHEWFQAEPVEFERCAIEIWRILAPATTEVMQTRAVVDGGRDAVGTYGIGPMADRVQLEFALEAKCWRPDRSIGVKQVSRLISRLKHRQFGVFVTTSWVARQVYEEVRQDGHPVVFICASDIVDALKTIGVTTFESLRSWLAVNHPLPAPTSKGLG